MADDHTETTETSAPQAVLTALRELYRERDDAKLEGLPEDAVFERVRENEDLAQPVIDDGLDELLRRGECYYSTDDRLRLVDRPEDEASDEDVAEAVETVEVENEPRPDGGTVGVSVAEFVRRSQAESVSPQPGVPRELVVEELGEDRLDEAERFGEVYVVGNRVKATEPRRDS